ncbi:kinase-like domain-containing protein [Rhizophagus irregularis DAOM 181602=DAOM 197198]|nr:kinase-like domain-containing protein [Rhizophagus irregularis DAOM 181602=DAOM 197198]
MDEIILSDDILEKIKNFRYYRLTKEQESLLDELIADKELIKCYKKHGSCNICNQPRTGNIYCRLCNSQRFKQNFKNWTSGNHDVDEFIQKAQLKAKGGFGTTYKAIWKEGYFTSWDFLNNNQLKRNGETKVALKCLHNSQDITADFLKEVESNILVCGSWIVRCFGKKLYLLRGISIGLKDIHNCGLIHHDLHCGNILSDFNVEFAYITDLGLCQPANVESTQNLSNRPKANDLEKFFTDLWTNNCNKDSIISKQIKEADEINKTSYLTLSSIGLSYITHSQAVYTSRLLDYKDLPEPRNSDNNDDSLGIEYSESLKMNFIKPDINSKDENN